MASEGRLVGAWLVEEEGGLLAKVQRWTSVSRDV